MRGLGGAPSGVLLPSSVNCGEALPATELQNWLRGNSSPACGAWHVWKHIAQTSGSTIATLPTWFAFKAFEPSAVLLVWKHATWHDAAMEPPCKRIRMHAALSHVSGVFLNVFLSQLKMRSKTLKAYQGDGWKAGAVLRWREKERQRCSFTMQPADIWAFILASIREPALRFTKT